jgi:sulfane dehydrogenase subunit SoxC
MKSRPPSRRRFLKNGIALAGLAAAAPAGLAVTAGPAIGQTAGAGTPDLNSIDAVLYGRRSRFVTTVRVIEGMSHPDRMPPRPSPYRPSARTPLGESMGIITPTSLHFTTQHFYGIPDIDPVEHKLMLHGLVERPLVFTVDELKRLPPVSRIHFLECIGNRPSPNGKTVADTHGRTGAASGPACRSPCCSGKPG